MKHMRRFYQAVAIPKMLYAAEVFLAPALSRAKGAKGMIKKLAGVQRVAAIAFPLLIEKTVFRAGTRLATLPETHILHKQVKRAARRYVKAHRTPMHEIFHGGKIEPESFEKIKPSLWGPKWTNVHQVTIGETRVEAIQSMNKYDKSHTVFSDGSCRDGKVGAAAVYWDHRERKHVRRKNLGAAEEHTVYEAETLCWTTRRQYEQLNNSGRHRANT